MDRRTLHTTASFVADTAPQQKSNPAVPPPGASRFASPAQSPTVISQPATSGGRSPSIASQGNRLNSGSLSGRPGPQATQSPHMPGSPRQATMPGRGHKSRFRRASAQSHGDFPPGIPPGGGRGGYQQGYSNHTPYPRRFPPMQPYQHRAGAGNVPPHFQGQMGPRPGSPHGPPRSPAPMGAHPGTPNGQPIQMHGQYLSYNGYASQMRAPPVPYNLQQPYDPSYGYHQQPYHLHPSYVPGQPSSPRSTRGFRPQPPQGHQQQQYAQGQYGQPPSHNMSRSSSQVSERPGSALGSQHAPPHGTTPANNHASHSHSQSTTAAANSHPRIPTRSNKNIVVENADGEVVSFADTKETSPAPALSQSPAPPSNPTPSPRTATTPTQKHARSDSRSGKSAVDIRVEIRVEFQEKVQREQDKGLGIKEEALPVIAKSQEPAASVVAKSESATETATPVAEEAARPVAEAPAVDVAAPREGWNVEGAKTEEQDAPVEAAPAVVDATPDRSVAQRAPTESAKGREKREDDEEMQRMIAEVEAHEKAEEERGRAYKEKRDKEKAAQAAKDKDEKDNANARMKQAERDAEALEKAREAERNPPAEKDVKTEDEKLFTLLKKLVVGPGAGVESGTRTPSPSTTTNTPVLEDSKDIATGRLRAVGEKPEPAARKPETGKTVKSSAPTPGIRSLLSARVLNLQSESVAYPDGIASPDPALNQSGRRSGKIYDKDFLMQFQEAFKEEPVVDWASKLVETLGESSVPISARAPSSRQVSRRGLHATALHTATGKFVGPNARTLPAGTSSQQRSEPSTRPQSTGSLATHFAGPGNGFLMGPVEPGDRGAPPGGGVHLVGPGSGRGPSMSSHNKGPRAPSAKDLAEQNKKMPLTAGEPLKPLGASGSGWRPQNIGRPGMGSQPDPSGNMAPDMVQRKVKSYLNKMTPERFDKISDEVLKIAAQSQRESDGRTLRQVIALLFEKACDEAHRAGMYAKFASRMLTETSPEIKDENSNDRNGQPIVGGDLVRKYLLNRCQEEFERGWEVNLLLSEDFYEVAMLSNEHHKAAAAKRKGLGFVQFIGELYKLDMLSAKIMHICVKRLLDFEGDPNEASTEVLTKLLRTVGPKLEEDVGAQMVSAYFQRIEQIMNTKGLPSRMYFMLLGIRDLRNSGWHDKDVAKGLKTIAEIREEAAAAQQKDRTMEG